MVFTLTEKLKFFESVFGAGKLARNSLNFDVRCPFCAPRDPSKKKLSIHVEDDKLHCWACGYKASSLAPLLRKFSTHSKLIEYRDKFMPSGTVKQFFSLEVEEKKIALPRDFRLLTIAPVSDPDVLSAWRYLSERGLTRRDAWYFKLGVSDESQWKRRIIVPSFDAEGSLNYFVARAIDRSRKPKYTNPEVDKLPIIFNEINVDWTSQLVLCEGVFDMFKSIENTVPLLGSDLNEESTLFNRIVVNETPVAIALDGDMWFTKTPRLVKKLAEYDIDVVVIDTRAWEDPGAMTKAEFKDALSRARRLEWNDAFKDKLFKASQTHLRV